MKVGSIVRQLSVALLSQSALIHSSIAALGNQVPVVCFLLHSAALLFVETATLRVAMLYVTTETLRVASSARVLRLPLSACAVGTVCGVPCAPNQPGFCRRHLRCDKPRVCIFSPFGWRKRPRTQCKLTAYRTNESRCGAVRCGAVHAAHGAVPHQHCQQYRCGKLCFPHILAKLSITAA